MGASLPCRHGEDDRWIIRARAPCRLFSTSQSRRDTRHTPPKQLERGGGSTVWEQHIEGPCSDGQVSLDRGLQSSSPIRGETFDAGSARARSTTSSTSGRSSPRTGRPANARHFIAVRARVTATKMSSRSPRRGFPSGRGRWHWRVARAPRRRSSPCSSASEGGASGVALQVLSQGRKFFQRRSRPRRGQPNGARVEAGQTVAATTHA